jgi:hypothetical protein
MFTLSYKVLFISQYGALTENFTLHSIRDTVSQYITTSTSDFSIPFILTWRKTPLLEIHQPYIGYVLDLWELT